MSTLLTTTILIIALFLNNVFAYQFYYCYNIIRNTERHKHEYTKKKFSGDLVKATVSNTIIGNILRNNCVSKKAGSNGQRLAENASRNNSTNVELSEDGKIGKVTNAKKDGDVSIYDQDGNKIGETLFDDDYLNSNGDEIDFDTKIGKALGKNGLYGNNAKKMINALIDFEIGSLKNGEENYPYVDYLGIMTTGIGININTNNQIKQLEFVDGNGKLVGNNMILFKEITNIKNKYTSNENNYELKNGIKQLKSDIIKQINNELHDLNYKITEKSKCEVFIKHIKDSRNSLSKQFSNYNNISTSSRMRLIDMIYNLGQNTFRTEYKKLSNVANNEDWIKAENESKIYNIQNSRNK